MVQFKAVGLLWFTYLLQCTCSTEKTCTPSENSRIARCTKLCSILNEKYPNLIEYEGESNYKSSYWSLQQYNTKPVCRFYPTCAQDVSSAIVKIQDTRCPFAVKGGGHAAFKGGSNIQNGIAIDLRNLTQLTVSKDNTVTRLGTGLHWEDVYGELDKRNLSVSGGRSGDVGLGLVFGGGISYYSGVYGWSCDTVENFQVVLADGRIVNANPRNEPELFRALRGGGNNFGVVTAVDLKTFKQGLMLGGGTIYSTTDNLTIYDNYYRFNQIAETDPKASLIVAAVCLQTLGCLFSNNYNHMDPIPVEEVPIYSNFTKLTSIADTRRISNMSDFAQEFKTTQPSGFRQAFITWTVRNDAQILKDIYNDIWHPSVQPVLTNATTVSLVTLALQPISIPIIKNFANNGGNSLGISEADGPLTLINMVFQWNSTADDDYVLGVERGIVRRSINLAKSRGLHHPYIYQNYAYTGQNVFDGYGKKSKNRLLRTQKLYDPNDVFTDLQPGYFKLRQPKPFEPDDRH